MVAPQTQSSGPASRHIPSDVPPAARCRGNERCAHRDPITRDRCGRGRELLALRHTASGTRLWPSCVKEVAARRADQARAPSVLLSTRPVPQPGARIRYHCLPPGAANAEPQAERHRSPEPRAEPPSPDIGRVRQLVQSHGPGCLRGLYPARNGPRTRVRVISRQKA